MLDLIQAYENYLTKVKHASANTIASYMRDIRQFSAWLSISQALDVIDATQLNIHQYLQHQPKIKSVEHKTTNAGIMRRARAI